MPAVVKRLEPRVNYLFFSSMKTVTPIGKAHTGVFFYKLLLMRVYIRIINLYYYLIYLICLNSINN